MVWQPPFLSGSYYCFSEANGHNRYQNKNRLVQSQKKQYLCGRFGMESGVSPEQSRCCEFRWA